MNQPSASCPFKHQKPETGAGGGGGNVSLAGHLHDYRCLASLSWDRFILKHTHLRTTCKLKLFQQKPRQRGFCLETLACFWVFRGSSTSVNTPSRVRLARWGGGTTWFLAVRQPRVSACRQWGLTHPHLGLCALRRSTWCVECPGGSERPWPRPGGRVRCSAPTCGCPQH